MFFKLSGQIKTQNSFQQHVEYNIHVKLNETKRTLQGNIEIFYTNNAETSLDKIYMHLWPNAYKNRQTDYAKQKLENGSAEFHFSDKSKRGYIDSINFSVDNETVKWQYTDKNDIAVLNLNKPILPKQSIKISTPFFVKIPNVFSRMGYENGIFCITQWYPKPAVYDINGWNAMPYLDQGEFYSEFGKFTVHITVPKNMVVAATGNLQNKEEIEWLKNLSNENANLSSGVNGEKTLTYIQDSVHDFAWFASRDFKVLHDTFTLHNGKEVTAWLFAKNIQKQGIDYIKKGVKFYSQMVGEYPYKNATVVITPLKAGGGMEYPTITNCASIDETTIVHEIGHNWFYGILGSNEREYPWMDESINTFYENWYQEKVNKNAKNELEMAASIFGFNIFPKLSGQYGSILTYQYTARQNKEQAGNLPSTQYTDINYGTIIYAKNVIAFFYLKNYLGENLFNNMMQSYFQKWKFKHPLPDDFRKHCETFTGKDLSWFFNSTLSNGRYDYSFKKNKNTLLIKNKLNGIGPVPVSTVLYDSVLHTVWVEPNKYYEIDKLIPEGLTEKNELRLTIHKSLLPLDLYGQNNQLWLKNNSLKAPLKLSPLFYAEKDHITNVYYAPVYAYNLYNKSMLGMALYNSIYPQKRNEFVLMPVYAFGTNDVNGYAQYWHNFYTQGKIQRLSLGFNAARFAAMGIYTQSNTERIQQIINSFGAYYGNITYEKLAPFVALNLKPKHARSEIVQQLQARYVMVNQQERDLGYFKNFNNHIGIAELSYNYNNPFILYPSSFSASYQQGLKNSEISRLGISFTQSILYKDGKQKADLRLFGGTFLFQQNIDGNSLAGDNYGRAMFQAAGTTGQHDYLYDYAMFGRAENNPQRTLWARQAILRDAGFRNFVSVGSTDKIIFAANLTLPLPISLPVGFYADASYANLKSITNNTDVSYNYQLTYIGGFYVAIAKNVVAWYFPLLQSNNINEAFNTQNLFNIFERSSIVLNLNNLNPIKAIRNIKF